MANSESKDKKNKGFAGLDSMVSDISVDVDKTCTTAISQQPIIPTFEISFDATEDDLYERIGYELESGNTHKPTWLRAFAQSGGDEKLTTATYIKQRLEKLQVELLEKKTLAEVAHFVEIREKGEATRSKLLQDKQRWDAVIVLKEKWRQGISLDCATFEELVKGLIDYGNSADIRGKIIGPEFLNITRYRGGNTLLHDAVHMEILSSIKLLIRAGASSEIKNTYGETPHSLSKNPEVLLALKRT